jgi:asparagine synthase (glutamine-hydrolysing)
MFKNGELKYLLKKLGEKHMYSDIFNRKKRGFGIPVKHWLKGMLKDFAAGHIADLVKRGAIVTKEANNLLGVHCRGEKDHTDRIWALVCLEIWLKKNF